MTTLTHTAPTGEEWRAFIARTAAGLGTGAIVAGVTYLVAWNWMGLGRWSKLSLGAGAVVGAAVLATALGLDRLSGRLAAAAGCGFAGAFLVLYTQVYQTGANAWELFAAFAVVCLPYAAATRLTALGGVAALSAQLAVLFGWYQLHPDADDGWNRFAQLWALGHAALVPAFYLVPGGSGAARTASILGVGIPAAAALVAIVGREDQPASIAAFLVLFGALHALRKDLLPVAWAITWAVGLVATFVACRTYDVLDDATPFLVAMVTTVLGALAAAWLRFLHRRSK